MLRFCRPGKVWSMSGQQFNSSLAGCAEELKGVWTAWWRLREKVHALRRNSV